MKGFILKRPTLATGSLAVIALIVTGLVWLITDKRDTATYTGFAAMIVSTLLQNVVLSAQGKDTKETVDKVEKQTNGQLSQQLQGVKDHVTTVVKQTPLPEHTADPNVIILPIGSRVYDYSFGRPSPLVLRHDGKGVIRYLSGIAGKDLTRDEALGLFKDGVPVVALVFETTADRPKAGFAAGQADARRALVEARSLGYPAHMPIYFANDEAAVTAQVLAYYRGVVSVLGERSGTYGGYALVARRITKWLWQTSAWSAGAIHPAAQLYQRQSETHPIGSTDENVVMHPHPAWLPHKA